MKKVILIDGNNLMFRSYFATIYSGVIMRTSKGIPTNALYGFINMINKIVEEEKPNYMLVAFDMGKNFRHEKYLDYKAGRNETPNDLKEQFPVAKEILDAMGIKYYEKEMYEADDIIGTFVKMALSDKDFNTTIVSSDKDLLQLINYETDVKLLKQKGHIRFNEAEFKKEYGLDPIKIIDIKALAGDPSDNIPGVKGIGEKTALTLLQNYGSLEGIYENIDNIKGAVKDKLINDKEKAFFSKELATIYKDVPVDISLEDTLYTGNDNDKLVAIFKKLEFNSLLKSIKIEEKIVSSDYQTVKNIDNLKLSDFSFYLECDKENYHNANILGMGVCDGINLYYLPKDLIKEFFIKFKTSLKYTFDLKKTIYLLKKEDIEIANVNYDLMLALYLLNYNIKDDLANIMNNEDIKVEFYDTLLKNKFPENELINTCNLKAKYIYETRTRFINELLKEEMLDLFNNIEMPLVTVLANMEYNGVLIDKSILQNMQESILIKIDNISKDIYNLVGAEFNISSPKQLGEILFDKLGLPFAKKTKTKYKTDVKILHKLLDHHPVIAKILEYRNLTKINNTYLEGLYKYIESDGRIHTIYKQTLTRTGRLSSVEPNLQNIPVREEEGRKIRKAFLPSNDSILISADYSQIELRILAHISGDETLINAFNKGEDIHTKVASDIFGVPMAAVSKEMRKSAKAVIFGIVYGISGFGLGENLEINFIDAKKFINKYYELYPKVKQYMENIIENAKECGCVKTLFNRKRVIEELKSNVFMVRNAGERMALNTPIQGTNADIIKIAMINIYNEIKKRKLQSKMILQVHDELIFDALKKEQKELEIIIKENMENVIKLSVPIKVEIDSGENWYEI